MLCYFVKCFKTKDNSTHFSCQKPPNQTNAMRGLIVARNCNINKSQRRIGVCERNNWDVDVRSLSDWLMISSWIRNNQQSWLTESSLDLIGECT